MVWWANPLWMGWLQRQSRCCQQSLKSNNYTEGCIQYPGRNAQDCTLPFQTKVFVCSSRSDGTVFKELHFTVPQTSCSLHLRYCSIKLNRHHISLYYYLCRAGVWVSPSHDQNICQYPPGQEWNQELSLKYQMICTIQYPCPATLSTQSVLWGHVAHIWGMQMHHITMATENCSVTCSNYSWYIIINKMLKLISQSGKWLNKEHLLQLFQP